MTKQNKIEATGNYPIRILVDGHCFDSEYGGSQTFLRELYKRLAIYPGLQIFIAAYDTARLKTIFPSSPSIVFVPYQSRSRYFRLLLDIPYLIRRYKIQIAHFQYITPFIR